MDRVRLVEAYSLNAWPAAQTIVYEGWLMRLNQGYTKRANCMCPMYGHWNDEHMSTIVQYGESIYKGFEFACCSKGYANCTERSRYATGSKRLSEGRSVSGIDPSLLRRTKHPKHSNRRHGL